MPKELLMKTKILLTVLIVLLVSLLSGCGDAEPTQAPTAIPPTSTPAPTPTPESTWQEFSSEEGWFAVSMPDTPVEQQQNQPSDAGDITLHIFMAEAEEAAYAVMYFDFPAFGLPTTEQDIEKALDNGRDGALANMSATLVSEERVSLGDHTGRHVVYEISEDTIPGGGEGVMRFFLIDGRVFQLLAIGAKGQLPAQNVTKFLDSFQVLEHPSPAARQEFVEYFAQGKLNGQAIINGNQAEVPFLYGPDGTDAETMDLIQRDGQWYLYGF
jgi:hypothetical protein